MPNHYKTLKVTKSATQQEIKCSYRDLAAKYHPDKKDGSADRFKELTNAYEVLGDPERRKMYDRTGSDMTEAAIDGKACGLLQQIFQMIVSKNELEAVLNIDMISQVNRGLDIGMGELEKSIDTGRGSRKKLGMILKRIRHSDKNNPISTMLKGEIKKHTEAVNKAKHELRIGKRAQSMWKEYRFDYDQTQWTMNHRRGYGMIGVPFRVDASTSGS